MPKFSQGFICGPQGTVRCPGEFIEDPTEFRKTIAMNISNVQSLEYQGQVGCTDEDYNIALQGVAPPLRRALQRFHSCLRPILPVVAHSNSHSYGHRHCGSPKFTGWRQPNPVISKEIRISTSKDVQGLDQTLSRDEEAG